MTMTMINTNTLIRMTDIKSLSLHLSIVPIQWIILIVRRMNMVIIRRFFIITIMMFQRLGQRR